VDDKRFEAGKKLLEAGHEFFNACRSEGQHGAVQWLTGTNGELVIFTRGEYLHALLNNIETLRGQAEHFFGEEMPTEDEDE